MNDKKRKCLQCQSEITKEKNPFRPFCSKRCKMVDLGRWLSEDYAIEGEFADDESSDLFERDDRD